MESVKTGSNSAPNSPCSSPPPNPTFDLVIGDYMERLGTRLGILETELRYAWRALDLLSQEYIKMWERLEKLEVLLYEQQSVISQLIEFYSAVEGGETEGDNFRLECVPSNQITISSDLGISPSAAAIITELKLDMGDGLNLPDEAFYRSLNNAYRHDLVCPSSSGAASGASQLGMIWEESEEDSNGNGKREDKELESKNLESQEVFSALDYKDYRGNSPCVSEHDLVQLSQLSTMDQVALEKLKELDILTTKLKKDSQNLKELQDRLLADSPKHQFTTDTTDISGINIREEDTHEIDEQLRRIYAETELDSWNYNTATRDLTEILILSGVTTSNSVPRLDNVGFISSPSSPRRYDVYSSASRLPTNDLGSHRSLPISPKSERYNFQSETAYTSTVIDYTKERVSPTPSLVRTRQDGYIGTPSNIELPETTFNQPSSPPPPAPKDSNVYLIPDHVENRFDSTLNTSTITCEQGRLSPRTPHSPKSPRTSPKHIVKSTSINIVTAKSDSGLSSMSGWSSLEKSPGSPTKSNSKTPTSYASENLVHIGRISQQHPIPRYPAPPTTTYDYPGYPSPPPPTTTYDYPGYPAPPPPTTAYDVQNYPYNEEYLQNHLLPGGHKVSSFTPVKTPTMPIDSESSFVPPPAPDTNSKRKNRYEYTTVIDFAYHNEQPAIYSVAGSHRQAFTSVYTSGASNYTPNTTVSSVPDLIGPHASQDQYSSSSSSSYQRSQSTSSYPTPTHKKTLTRVYSTGSVPNTTSVSNLEGYKTAMYRTMFPTGNITDALSYYPTNTFDGQNRTEFQKEWEEPTRMVRDATSSTIRSEMYDARGYDPRYYPNRGVQRDSGYSEYDLRNKSMIDISDQQYYDPCSVIVSQSGYISISADIKDPQDDKSKKSKRSSGLKSAMSSVSNWLPDIHLPKRHRSYSLPTGVRREDLDLSREVGKRTLSQRSKPVINRKKKKHPLVTTVSEILHKAKRRHQPPHSMSDPEQSETEWSGRQSGVSEDSEDSVFSDIPHDMFSKVQSGKVQRSNTFQPTTSQDFSEPVTEPIETISNVEENVAYYEDETPLFATVGEAKKQASTSDESGDGMQFPPVTLGGASREFAVSRALGKYRRRQSTSIDEPEESIKHDEPITVITQDEEEEELRRNEIFERISSEENNKQYQQEEVYIDGSPVSKMHSRHHPPRHQASLEIPWGGRGSGDTDDDNRSTHSWRSTSRVSSRRQSTEDSIDSEDEWYCYELRKLEELERQSRMEAEMPIEELYEPEEDVKERMSFVLRELRLKVRRNDERDDVTNLRRGSIESRTRRDSYERIDDVPKERFERESRRGSYEKNVVERRGSYEGMDRERRDSFERHGEHRRGSHDRRGSLEKPNVESRRGSYGKDPKLNSTFNERVREIGKTEPWDESVKKEKYEEIPEPSSGDTSGPDSPHQSMDDINVEEEVIEEELALMRRSSSGSTLRQSEKHFSGSVSREGSLSVPPSEVSVSLPEGWDTEETATVREGSVSVPVSEESNNVDLGPGTPSLPRFKSDEDEKLVSIGKDEPAGRDASGPQGSKWKLLKALKERKAEKKIQEAAQAESAATATAVSILCFVCKS